MGLKLLLERQEFAQVESGQFIKIALDVVDGGIRLQQISLFG